MKPKHLGKRKRQRPSYLHDFLDEQEDGEVDSQKTSVIQMKPTLCEDKIENEVINVIGKEGKCCLCAGQLLNNRVNISSATGSSDLSYSHVLNKIIPKLHSPFEPQLVQYERKSPPSSFHVVNLEFLFLIHGCQTIFERLPK